MKTHPSKDGYQETLSFSSAVAGVGMSVGVNHASVWKAAVLRWCSKTFGLAARPPETEDREETAGPVFESTVLSRYEVDDYGQPRPLSKVERLLHALAWPVVAGAVIGFGLGVALLAFHASSALPPPEKSNPPQVALQEAP